MTEELANFLSLLPLEGAARELVGHRVAEESLCRERSPECLAIDFASVLAGSWPVGFARR